MTETHSRRLEASGAAEKLWLEVVDELAPGEAVETDSSAGYGASRVREIRGHIEIKAPTDSLHPHKVIFATRVKPKHRKAFSLFRNPASVSREIDKGIPVTVLSAAVARGVLRQGEIRIVLPDRTFRSRKKHDEVLTKDESDKFARMLQTIEFATETFGSTEKAHRWLRQPKKRFDGKTPIEMLDTSLGAQAVQEMLVQIAHGIAA